MSGEQWERLVQSFESIAESLRKTSDIQQRTFYHQFPEKKEPREAVVTRIKTEEDLARERQGASTGPLSEWFGGFEEELGKYEKEFLEKQRQQNASTSVSPESKSGAGGIKTVRSKTRRSRRRPTGDSAAEMR